MVIGRNEYGDNLVLALGNKLLRAYTEIWNDSLQKYEKKGYWTTASHHDPMMSIYPAEFTDTYPDDPVYAECAILNEKYKDLKWEDAFVTVSLNIESL